MPHQDLKSPNILLGRDTMAKIADVGLARSVTSDAAGLSQMTAVCDSPGIASGAVGASVEELPDACCQGYFSRLPIGWPGGKDSLSYSCCIMCSCCGQDCSPRQTVDEAHSSLTFICPQFSALGALSDQPGCLLTVLHLWPQGMGTLAWAAPELLRNFRIGGDPQLRAITHKADVFR